MRNFSHTCSWKKYPNTVNAQCQNSEPSVAQWITLASSHNEISWVHIYRGVLICILGAFLAPTSSETNRIQAVKIEVGLSLRNSTTWQQVKHVLPWYLLHWLTACYQDKHVKRQMWQWDNMNMYFRWKYVWTIFSKKVGWYSPFTCPHVHIERQSP